MRRPRGGPVAEPAEGRAFSDVSRSLAGFHDRLKQAIGAESQNAFARRAGIPQSTLSAVWRGGEPTLSTLTKISVAAGVSLSWLALGEEDESPLQPPVASGNNSVLDHETLKVVIEEIEEHLRSQRKSLAPAKKAELISLAYTLVSQAPDHQQKGATILRLVQLAG